MSERSECAGLSVRRVIAIAVACAGGASCGGNDTASKDTVIESTVAIAADSPEVTQGGSTTVTVGDEEFVFSQQVECATSDGYLAGSFFSDDGAATFDVFLPPEVGQSGTDEQWVPSVRLDDYRKGRDMPISWRAGDEFMDGPADVPSDVEVTSYEIDGETTSGTASVVRFDVLATGVTEVAEMTFSVTCL